PPAPRGHAFEFRLNAEDPALGFLPTPGTVEVFQTPTGAGIRVDTGVRSGSVVPPHYDSMLAKLIVWGQDRQQALRRSRAALAELSIKGLPTVAPFHRAVVEHLDFTSPDELGVYTTWIEDAFTQQLEASPYVTSGAAERTTLTVDLDGKAVQLGLPTAMVEALLHGGGAGAGGEAVAASTAHGASDTTLAAPMDGTVVKWAAEDGANISEGDTVLVLEAMKMETPVRAHRSGTLTRGEPNEGDAVRKGQALGEIA
ncbi:MAG: acetyl-/propionyl-CoA carboxylase subunit alpha, partial [Kocuria rhizophila]